MSSLWTPSGERPVGRGSGESPEPQYSPADSDDLPNSPYTEGDGALSEEELALEMAEVQRQLLEVPAAVVIANHGIGIFQLAALHLNQENPRLDEAQLAIDALAAIVEGLGPRLSEHEEPLRDALAQIRLAYVQIKSRG
jgi:hypothetical protein